MADDRQEAEAVEVVEVVLAPPSPSLRGRNIERPVGGAASMPLQVSGWVLPLDGAVDRVEILAGDAVVATTEVGVLRPDLEVAFADVAEARSGGFRTLVDFKAVTAVESLTVRAVLEGGEQALLGTIRLARLGGAAAPKAGNAPGQPERKRRFWRR